MKLQLETESRVLEWASRYPHVEVTGFVKRMPNGDEIVVPMQNISKTPTTDYAWATGDMVEQWGRMDAEGSEPIALYHSHPGGKRDPSEVDMTAALMPDLVYLIAYPGNTGDWHLSAWFCLEPGILVEETLERQS